MVTWTDADCDAMSGLCAEALETSHAVLPGLMPTADSLVGQIRRHFALVEAPASDPLIGTLLTQAASGYALMAAEQLAGMGVLYSSGPTIRLFPAVTLLRGLAEAAGRAFWLLDPWTDKDGMKTDADWRVDTRRILGRLELMLVETYHARVRRQRAQQHQPPVTDPAAAQTALREAKDRIVGRDPSAKLKGNSKTWSVYGEQLPVATEWVTAATEYAHGQQHRGTGLNMYPLYSGYAHASLDVLLMRPSTTPMMEAVTASPDEARRLAGTGLRTFAAAFDAVLSVHGRTSAWLAGWEERADAIALGR